jgi:hypothetical protein
VVTFGGSILCLTVLSVPMDFGVAQGKWQGGIALVGRQPCISLDGGSIEDGDLVILGVHAL